MTLTFYKDNTEIMSQCVLWWQGRDQTTTGFPIIPSGVTATPAGTWANDLSLGNNKTLKTFDGSTNYISLTDNDAWTMDYPISAPTTNFTFAVWLRLIDNTKFFNMYGQHASGTSYFGLLYQSAPRLYFGAYNGSTYMFFCYITTGTLVNGTWYHIVVERSGSSCLAYINGEPTTADLSTPWNAAVDISAPLRIGEWNGGCGNGNIKDLMIFKGRALTQPEIKLLMELTNPNTGREFELLYPGQRGVE